MLQIKRFRKNQNYQFKLAHIYITEFAINYQHESLIRLIENI